MYPIPSIPQSYILVKTIELKLNKLNFFCPLTGQKVIDGDKFTPSPVTAFAYLDEIGEFLFSSLEMQGLIREIDPQNQLYGNELLPKLTQALAATDLICFKISITKLLGSDPVSCILRIAFAIH